LHFLKSSRIFDGGLWNVRLVTSGNFDAMVEQSVDAVAGPVLISKK
jgi:hypothetical protein